MALFALFDTSENPEQVSNGARVEEARARKYLQLLDL
jgi:hypothetical protein